MRLLPQLPLPFAEPLAAQYGGMSVEECRRHRDTQHSNRIFSPIGGTRITDIDYAGLVRGIAGLAEAAGYPSDGAKIREKFDVELAIYLEKELNITDNEASKPGVWNFMSCIALPDLVRWRFQAGEITPANRFLSGQKNLFERLWWRAKAYRDSSNASDPYWLVREIGEDESVGIMERTTLSGIRAAVPLILRTLIDTAETNKHFRRSEIMREAMKRFLRVGSIVAIETLDAGALEALCTSVFGETLGISPQRTAGANAGSSGANVAKTKTVGAKELSRDRLSNLAETLRQNQVRKERR